MCINGTYSRVRVGKHLSNVFRIKNGLKQGDVLPPMLFNFALKYAITKVQKNQQGWKLYGARQVLVYDDDDINILNENVHTLKRNTEALVVASKEIGLEVNAEKTKYFIMSRDQAAGTNHNIKIDIKSLERVDQFKYLGKILTNSNSIHEAIKSRLKSGNACYHLEQNLWLPVCYPKRYTQF